MKRVVSLPVVVAAFVWTLGCGGIEDPVERASGALTVGNYVVGQDTEFFRESQPSITLDANSWGDAGDFSQVVATGKTNLLYGGDPVSYRTILQLKSFAAGQGYYVAGSIEDFCSYDYSCSQHDTSYVWGQQNTPDNEPLMLQPSNPSSFFATPMGAPPMALADHAPWGRGLSVITLWLKPADGTKDVTGGREMRAANGQLTTEILHWGAKNGPEHALGMGKYQDPQTGAVDSWFAWRTYP